MIAARQISKSYSKLSVYSDFELTLRDGCITTILGRSGFGKTTLLNLIAGVELPDSGEIKFPQQYTVGYLLQENILLPWRTLRQNIQLSTEVMGKKARAPDTRVDELLHRFGLEGFEDYYPDALSGGMKQRAALIRSLIIEPTLILLDEPFSNLDFDIKLKIQQEIISYQKEIKATVIIVTHDIEDAIALSDEVIVLSGKPATVKATIPIDLSGSGKDPVLARKSSRFPMYFSRIWEELK